MKKIIFCLITILSLFIIVGCAPNTGRPVEPPKIQQEHIYELAVESGYDGTYEEWLDSIKGENGKDGISIEDVTISSEGNLEITLSNGTMLNLGNIKGEDGIDGTSIKEANINTDGHLILTLTDNTEVNCGKVPTCNHIFNDWTNEIKATCTSIGVDTRLCTLCGLKDYKFEEALEHKFNDWTTLISTCTEHKESRICSECNKVELREKTIQDNKHIYVDAICVNCGHNNVLSKLKFTLLEDGTYELTSCLGLFENIEVPSTYNNKPVTKIGEYAFNSSPYLIKISLPETIIVIEEDAFYNCRNLESIEIPNSVTSIGSSAFSNCTSLTNIEISNSVTSIGSSVFSNCTSLTNIEIPNSVISIGIHAFQNCTSLESIEIPNSVTSIGGYTFSNCTSLTSIEIPNSVTSIGSSAFYGCTSLTSIEIPNSVTSIGSTVFRGCTSLESITLPFVGATLDGTSDTHFGYIFGANSYSYNNDFVPTSLKEVIITGGTSIGYAAFYNCINLESITLPFVGATLDGTSNAHFGYIFGAGLSSHNNGYVPRSLKEVIITGGTSIGSDAFFNCTSLTSIEIPNSITSIGYQAFYNCRGLESIEIPNSVTSIGSYAFFNCKSLTSIEIPNSLTSIGDSTFNECTSLTIYCEAKSKPSGWSSSWNQSKCPVVWDYKNKIV